MRLLIFAPYFPPHVGGLEGYVSDLDDAMLERPEVQHLTVFAPRLPDAPAEEQRGSRHLVVRFPAFELIPNFPVPSLWRPAFWRALRLARGEGADVLVSHTRFFLSSAFALLCARAMRRPLLHVEHGSDYVQLSGRAARLAARLYDLTLGRLLLRRADGVVAISAAAAAFVRALAGRDAAVVYRGMHVDELDAVEPSAAILAQAAGRPVVTFAGRLIDGKGVPDLIRAFAGLSDRDGLLCIVGDGPRRVELEALAGALGLGDRVLFAGYLTEREAWAVVRASDVVVNPSYTEGLPTSVLEGALMGKAIVASDVGGTAEIVTHEQSGLLYAPRDVDALRERLARVLGDGQLRARLGQEARAGAAGRFDWTQSAGRFLELAGSLARRTRGDQPAATGGAASTSAKTDS